MPFVAYSIAYSFSLFLAVLLCLKVGFDFGKRKRTPQDEPDELGEGTVTTAVFGLLGLLVAFSFAGTIERYDTHRDLVAEEASAISGAYERFDLLPESDRPPLRSMMRDYAKARIDSYRAPIYSAAEEAALAHAAQIQEQMWKQAIEAAKATGNPAILTLTSQALEAVFDAPVKQHAALQRHPPLITYVLLYIVALTSALLAGYGMFKHRRLPIMHSIMYAATVAVTLFVILDLEYPRVGFFNPDPSNRVMVEVLENMK
jgi:hypothetical protein